MNIHEFADIIDKSLIITRYPNQHGRFSAHFNGGEVRVNSCLASYYGNGFTPAEALNEYTQMIIGATLVFNATDPENRQTFVVPNLVREDF